MFRPRTSSSAARSETGSTAVSQASPSPDTSALTLLSEAGNRSRAVDNDYSDHPLVQQSNTGQRDHIHGRDSSNQHARTHRHPGAERSRRQQHHSGRTRRMPGSASRVNTSSSSLPSYLVSRDPSRIDQARPSNRLESSTGHTPVIPPRPYPQTVGHLPSRRRNTGPPDLLISRPPPPIPDSNFPATTFQVNPSIAPPRPPPPTPEVAARLGVPTLELHSHVNIVTSIGVKTTQPLSRTSVNSRSDVVITQPTAPKVPHKDQLADSKSDKSKTSTREIRTDEKKLSSELNKSSNKSSLKKITELDNVIGDEDHQLIGPGSGECRAFPKPGDHNYPCPRCGKCMCPRCQGDIPNTSESARRSASHCWMCNHRCLCSLDSCVETATCLCCVRACFYHCSNYDDDDTCTDKPCSCRGSQCCLRWTALSALSLVLPCLLCYPAARGCIRACRSCADCVKPGCRCKESYR